MNEGITNAAALIPRPSSNSFFLPMRAANTPPGTLNIGEGDEDHEGQQRGHPFADVIGLLTASALGPMASASPIRKKARKMGMVFSRKASSFPSGDCPQKIRTMAFPATRRS